MQHRRRGPGRVVPGCCSDDPRGRGASTAEFSRTSARLMVTNEIWVYHGTNMLKADLEVFTPTAIH